MIRFAVQSSLLVVIFIDTRVISLVDLVEHAGHLLLKELLQLLLRLLIQVVLDAEVSGELLSSVTLVHDDALLLTAAKVDIHEEERLVFALELVAGILTAHIRRLGRRATGSAQLRGATSRLTIRVPTLITRILTANGLSSLFTTLLLGVSDVLRSLSWAIQIYEVVITCRVRVDVSHSLLARMNGLGLRLVRMLRFLTALIVASAIFLVMALMSSLSSLVFAAHRHLFFFLFVIIFIGSSCTNSASDAEHAHDWIHFDFVVYIFNQN